MGATIGASSIPISPYTYLPECNLATPIVQDDPGTATTNETNSREFGRFFVVDPSGVSYNCDTTNGFKRTVGGVGTLLVDPTHVSACNISCDSSKARVQLITFNLSLKDKSNEVITLLRRVTVVNKP